MKRTLVCAALVGAALSATAAPPFGENNELSARRVQKGAIKIDGNFDDWQKGGEIFSCYDPEVLSDIYSVRTRAAYDETGFYLAMRWRTKEAHCNLNDPVNRPSDGWRGDAVQLRFKLEGKYIAHVDSYWSDASKRTGSYVAFGTMKYGDSPGDKRQNLNDAEKAGMKSAYTFDADGRGYRQEVFIPWTILHPSGKALGPKDDFRLGFQFHWHNPNNREGSSSHVYCDNLNPEMPQREFFWIKDEAWGRVRLLAKGEEPPPDAPAKLANNAAADKFATSGLVPITYTLDADANVTLAINDAAGKRIRNLISDFPRKKGVNTDWWDGLDDNGAVAPPGVYTVKGLTHGPYDLLYRFQYGSPGDPGWNTTDGSGDWLSDHARPAGVASDGKWKYFSHHTSEGGSTLIGLDETFHRRWGLTRLGGGSLLVRGKFLYMVEGGSHPPLSPTPRGKLFIRKFDARAGREANFANGKSAVCIFEYPEKREIPVIAFPGVRNENKGWSAADLASFESWGFAQTSSRFYVSLYFEDKILEIDPETAEVTGSLALKSPLGLSAAPDGALLAVSGDGKVYKFVEGAFKPFITDLEAPFAITSDAQGRIYCTDYKDRMNIRVYDAKGNYQRSIGRPGGRPIIGRYEPDGVFLPVALAADGEENLLVAEFDFTPKRHSVWNRATGVFVREFCGPTWYGATECNVDVLKPTQAFCCGTCVDLDWQKGKWRTASTLWRPMKHNAYFGPVGEGRFLTTLMRGEQEYVFSSRSQVNLSVSILQKDGAARPVVHRGRVQEQIKLLQIFANKVFSSEADLAYAKKRYPMLFREGVEHPGQYWGPLANDFASRKKTLRDQFIWCDLNGDGAVDDDEIDFFSPNEANGLKFTGNWRSAYDDDFNQYLATFGDVGKRSFRVWKWPVHKWLPNGVPVYRKEDVRVIATTEINGIESISHFGLPWGQTVFSVNPMISFDKDGKELWRYPNKYNGVQGSHAAPKEMNGLIIGTLKGIGYARLDSGIDILAFNSNMGQANFLTSDGLYAGRLLRDNRTAPDAFPQQAVSGDSFKNMCAGAEWFGGEFFRNRDDGKFYLGFGPRNGGGNCQALCEVTGFETLRRLPTRQIEFSADAAKKALEIKRTRQLSAATDRTVVTMRGATNAADGSLDWAYDETHQARGHLRLKDNAVVLTLTVQDDSPFVNKGTDWRYLFKTGDSVLFEFRALPDDGRHAILKGDTRILFANFKDKPVAVLNRRYAQEGEEKHPGEFSSPVMSIKFDVVRLAPEIDVKVNRGSDSYTLTATIPFAALGFTPQAGHGYRADFGVIYGSKAGDTNELRMNWSNKKTGLVSDIPGEANLVPAEWGVWQVR